LFAKKLHSNKQTLIYLECNSNYMKHGGANYPFNEVLVINGIDL